MTINLDSLIHYAELQEAERSQHFEGVDLIRQGELLKARATPKRYELSNEDLTAAVVELSKRLKALEEKSGGR